MTTWSILALLPLVAVAASVFGLVWLTLGVRGKPVFSSPRCAKCNYDLRNMQFMSQETVGNCPECGNDLAAVGGVTFGRWEAQPRRIVVGVAMMVLPWALTFALIFGMRSRATATRVGPQGSAAKTTPALIAGLQTRVDQPWDWQELQRRLQRGELSNADADAAIGVLIADLNAKRAAGKRREPLHWAGNFVTPAISGGSVSQKQVLALAQAYYGTEPKFTIRSRAREGEPIAVTLNEHESWNLPNMQFCWALTSITADGTTKLAPQLRYPRTAVRQGEAPPPMKPDELSGNERLGQFDILLPHALPPGEHEIAFTFEMGVVPENATMRGLDGKPGTPDKWPTPIARWQSVVKRKITVQPKDQSPVQLVTDAQRDPFKSSTVTVEEALARPATNGVELVLKFKFDGEFSPPLGYRVTVQAGEEKFEHGTMLYGRTSRGTMQGVTEAKRLKQLAPDVRTIDITLTPDPKVAEGHTGIEEIWGKPHRIRDVKLERFDLGDEGTDASPAGAERKGSATQPG